MDEAVKTRIEKEGLTYSVEHYDEPNNRTVSRYSYIAGATAEQERFEKEFKRIAGLILQVRDALALSDCDDAYHALYQIASPNFDKTDPWKELEAITSK